MITALEREEAGSKKSEKQKYNASFTPKIALPLDGMQLKMEMQQLLRSSTPPMTLVRAP